MVTFEAFVPKNTGVNSMRYKLGRKSNTNASIVGYVAFRVIDNKRHTGTVSFTVEFHTCMINGSTGQVQPPHLSAKEHLKDSEAVTNVIEYAKSIIPRNHVLCSKGAWHTLARGKHVLAAPIGFA